MNVGETTCGKVTAKMEEWPLDGNKNYVKLYGPCSSEDGLSIPSELCSFSLMLHRILTIIGPGGGLVFDEREDANLLRFPEHKLPGEINVCFTF